MNSQVRGLIALYKGSTNISSVMTEGRFVIWSQVPSEVRLWFSQQTGRWGAVFADDYISKGWLQVPFQREIPGLLCEQRASLLFKKVPSYFCEAEKEWTMTDFLK